jgi:hypothetical protein
MKYLLYLVFAAILLTGCNSQENTPPAEEKNKFDFDSTDIKTESVENAGEEFQLAYKFNEGDKIRYRVTRLSEIIQEIDADTLVRMDGKNSVVYLLNITPSKTDNDGNTELNCVVTSGKIEAENNGMRTVYDSDSVKTKEDKDKYASEYAVINNEFSVRVSKYGELLDVYKTDRIVNSFLEYKNAKDSASAEDKTYLKTQIAETMLKPLLSQIFRKIPENTVARDSSWVIKQPRRKMLIFEVDQTNKFVIKNLEKLKDDKIAVVGVEMITNIMGDNKVTEQGISYDIKKPKISGSGTFYFNIDKGFLQKLKSETYSESAMTAEGNTPQGYKKQSSKEKVKTYYVVEKL